MVVRSAQNVLVYVWDGGAQETCKCKNEARQPFIEKNPKTLNLHLYYKLNFPRQNHKIIKYLHYN